MKRFMGFCKNGGVRHAICTGAVIALCFSVLCMTSEKAYSWSLQESCTSSDIAAAASCEQIISAAAGSTQIVVSPDPLSDDDLQIVLSMGELPESICISWKGEADGPGYIKIAGSRKGLKTVKAVKASSEKTLKGSYYRYRVRFDGLEPGEKYHYVIGSFEGGDDSQSGSSGGQGHWVKAGRVRSFRMPKVSEPTQFLYLGDVQFDVSPEEYEQWGEMTAWIFNENPGLQFAVLGGDMVNIPGEYEQEYAACSGDGSAYIDSSRSDSVRSAAAQNDDASDVRSAAVSVKSDQQLAEELRGDFYYFDQGSCRFIMTDSSFLTDERIERLGTRSWQLCEKKIEDWIARTLEESPKPWNIVVTHHPPYGLHDKDTVSPQLRELWVPVMEAHGADLVLCGHQHMYMRTEAIGGIVYVMGNSGNMKSAVYEKMDTLPDYCMALSGNGPNYQIIDAGRRKLQLTSYDADGLIIDRFTIRKSLWEVIAGIFR